MTPDDVITELLGEGWAPDVLPHLLDFLKTSLLDADRYHFIRDFANTLTFSNNPRNRLQMLEFDRMLDEKRHDFDENY